MRGGRYDVIAVRNAASGIVANGKILPILEPIKVSTRPLVRHSAAFGAAGMSVGLVMNPQVGELFQNTAATTQLLADMRAAGATVVPALIVNGATGTTEMNSFAAHLQGGRSIYVHYDVPSTPQVVAQVRAAQGESLTLARESMLERRLRPTHPPLQCAPQRSYPLQRAVRESP